jgi:hypothetical protein
MGLKLEDNWILGGVRGVNASGTGFTAAYMTVTGNRIEAPNSAEDGESPVSNASQIQFRSATSGAENVLIVAWETNMIS